VVNFGGILNEITFFLLSFVQTKDPSLEKVVGLELDQYVLRNSFRYFNSQPHFDDKRVEWWFGDGAKSLLMLPKDYFQSFDLVVVDLSETVMSFQVTNKLSIFQTLSLLLKPDGILLKNGEYYMEKMSTYFDYTLQYFEYDVPFICDQGMVIGSNKIDFFNRTIKDHGVELLVLESQEEILEKFNKYYRFTEYRKNDANAQKQCEDLVDDEERNNAGILMVLEAEKVTHDLQSSEAVEKTISDALKDVGFSIVSTVTHESSNFVIVTKEGYVAVRLYPEKAYVGLDIQLWANFDLMQPASDALVESLGGTEEGTSSFRIVTGGMSGSPFQEVDKTKIGPRMVNTRNCEAHSSPSSEDKIVDLMGSSLEGSLAMIEDGVVAAVVCGSKDKPCKRLDILNKAPQSKLTKVIPVYTCKSMQTQGAEFSKDVAHKMAACEVELSDTLGSAGDKVSLLVIDDSAERFMGKVLLSLFGSVWNRKRLFTQNRFVAFVDSSSGGWRRNLLALIRNKIVYKPMSFVDVVVENSKDESTFSILSLQDPAFFLHLREMVDTYNEAHGEAANMEVKKVFDGLPPPQIGKFNPKIFLADDYDPTPAQEQLKGQTALGRQSLVQFEIQPAKIVNTVKVEAATIEAALDLAIDYDELEFTFFQDIANIGDGLVAVAYTSDGKTSAILKWDGKTHIDVNLFSADESPLLRKKFIDVFVETLNSKIPVQLALSDTHPRGVGRVISFPGHMN
jgi:S-adenosylmethionine/arginine decarboxylase-like enzyme